MFILEDQKSVFSLHCVSVGWLIQPFPPPVPYNPSTHLAKTEPHWALGDVQMEDFIRLACLSLRQSAMVVLDLDGWNYSGAVLSLQFLNVWGFLRATRGCRSRLTYDHAGVKSIFEMKNKFEISENAASCLETVLRHCPMLVFRGSVHTKQIEDFISEKSLTFV